MINLYSTNQILTYIYVPSTEIYGSILLLSHAQFLIIHWVSFTCIFQCGGAENISHTRECVAQK
jgi:hypothetical protein